MSNKDNETWYCSICKKYGNKQTMITEHKDYGHIIQKRSLPSERIIYTNEGHIYLTAEGEKFGVIPVLAVFSDSIIYEPIKFNVISENTLNPWRNISKTHLDGNLKNVAKKLSHLQPKISESQLEKLLTNAIKNGTFQQTVEPNIIKIMLCRDKDLTAITKPDLDKAKWTVITPLHLMKAKKKLLPEDEVTKLAHEYATPYRQKAVGE